MPVPTVGFGAPGGGIFHPYSEPGARPGFTAPTNAFELEVYADGPSLVLRCDALAGPLVDLISGLVANPSGSPTYGVAGGPFGLTGIAFPTTSDFFSIANHPALSPGDGPATWEIIGSRGSDSGGSEVALSKGTNGYNVGLRSDDTFALGKPGVTHIVRTAATVPADSAVNLWDITRASSGTGNSLIYKNAVADTVTIDETPAIVNNANVLEIGREGAAARWTGAIYYIVIYPSVLSPTRITAHNAALASVGNVTVTPATATLILSALAPVVTASDHQLVTPATASLAITASAPVIDLGVIPATASLALAGLAPTVALTANQTAVPATAALTLTSFAPQLQATVTPATAALALTSFAPVLKLTVTPGLAGLTLSSSAPTVTSSNNQVATPGTASLALAAFAPQLRLTVTPPAAALTLSGLAPTVTTTANQTVVPGAAVLALASFAPLVTGGAGLTVVPGKAALTLSGFAPTVTMTANQTATPGTAALALSSFAPLVTAPANKVVIPATALLTLLGLAPTVIATGQSQPGTVGATATARDSVGSSAVLMGSVAAASGPGSATGAATIGGTSVGASATLRDKVGAA